MNTHRLLQRQLRRQLGVESIDALRSLLSGGDPAGQGALLAALPGFLQQVNDSYALYDRDIALAARSLQISSEELLDANRVQERTLGHLRQALHRLAAGDGLPAPTQAESGLESISHRLSSLIAAQRQAQSALQASEAKFRALTKLSSDWYWEQDAQFRFIDTVGRGNDRGGLSAQQHVGRCHWELPDTEALNTTWADHRALLQAHERFENLMLRRRTADGNAAFVEVSGEPVFDDDGVFVGYRGIARNVTSRVLAQAALQDAKATADAASAAKSQFLAHMSHEIRTPMNGMLGMAELLLDDGLPAAYRERVGLLQASGRSLLGIINDILDFSKIEAGRLDLESAPFDLRESIEHSMAMFAPLAADKGIALRLSFEPAQPVQLMGDVLRLKQVLGNLLNNAIKFTSAGHVHLRVRCAATEHQLVRTDIAVEDTGPGLDRAVVETLFTAFTQGDASTSRRFGGTGLGLAICKHITQLMGGQIGVDSRPGQGSTFWVSIPMGRALAPRADEVAAQPHAADAWDGRRVLLVEDNPTNLIVAQTHLERMGLRVQTAEDGVQALDALRNGTYDIVLMDCQMPNMDGYEAVRRWREFEMSRRGLGRRLPIVALTANAMSEDRQRSLAAGYDDHLGKPFSGAELRQMLDHWLEVSVS